MIKPKPLVKGDKVAVVSISSGILGEDFAKHELDLGLNRIKEFGLNSILKRNKGLKTSQITKLPQWLVIIPILLKKTL